MRRLVNTSLLRLLLSQQLSRTLILQCPHPLVIAPDQVLCQLLVEVLQAVECFPIVEIPLVISVAALHFSVVPWRSRRNLLVGDPKLSQRLIKRSFLCVTDILVGKLCAIVRLDRLDFERKYLQYPQKFN